MENKISISYDKKADVLYFSIGKPKKAESREIDEGIFARYSPKSKKLVGFTVVNFSKKFKSKPKDIDVPVKV